jgi:hypothetical protein
MLTLDEICAALRGSKCQVFFAMEPLTGVGMPQAGVHFSGMRVDLDRLLTPEFQRSFHALQPEIAQYVSKNDTRFCPEPDIHRATWKYIQTGLDAGLCCETCADERKALLDKMLKLRAAGIPERGVDFGKA